jgi:hypothetical protein
VSQVSLERKQRREPVFEICTQTQTRVKHGVEGSVREGRAGVQAEGPSLKRLVSAKIVCACKK